MKSVKSVIKKSRTYLKSRAKTFIPREAGQVLEGDKDAKKNAKILEKVIKETLYNEFIYLLTYSSFESNKLRYLSISY
jgi:hypothetical protein